MTARAIVWDGSFGDPTLPKIELAYAPILPGAIYDWSADSLPLGLLPSWGSAVGGATLTANGSPQVVESGGGKAVRLDGTVDRYQNRVVVSGPRTFAIVYRFTAVEASNSVLYGRLTDAGGAIMTDSGNAFVAGRAGGTLLGQTPPIVPDTNWHVAVLTVNNSASAFRHDNIERTGTLPLNDTDGITLGFGGSPDFRGPIEYKRVAILAGGTTAVQRNEIVAHLASRYGVNI